MNVLVVGSAGRTGRAVVTYALAEGHTVTGLQRAKGGVDGMRLVVGDATDPGVVAVAIEGVDTVICALGESASGPADGCARATAVMLDQLERQATTGVSRPVHFVCVTGAMIGHAQDRLSWIYRFMEAVSPTLRASLQARRAQERRVRASPLPWTIVRPPRLTDGPAIGSCRASEDLWIGPFATISRADLAAFLVDRAGTEHFVHRAVAVMA